MVPFCLGGPPHAHLSLRSSSKTINLLIYGYESEPVTVSITPDDTSITILKQAGLDGCFLVRNSEPQRYYHDADAPYTELTEGEVLFAVLPND